MASGTGTAVGQTLHTFTNTGNSTLALNALTPVLSGTISGAGNLTVDATGGTVALTGSNTYANTTLSGGTLKVGNNTSTGTLACPKRATAAAARRSSMRPLVHEPMNT